MSGSRQACEREREGGEESTSTPRRRRRGGVAGSGGPSPPAEGARGSGSSRGTGIAFSSRFGCRESLHSTPHHSTPLLRWRLLLEKESAAFGTGGAIERGRFGSIRRSGRRRPPWRARYGGGLERERKKAARGFEFDPATISSDRGAASARRRVICASRRRVNTHGPWVRALTSVWRGLFRLRRRLLVL